MLGISIIGGTQRYSCARETIPLTEARNPYFYWPVGSQVENPMRGPELLHGIVKGVPCEANWHFVVTLATVGCTVGYRQLGSDLGNIF
jgi:hypothetical protein